MRYGESNPLNTIQDQNSKFTRKIIRKVSNESMRTPNKPTDTSLITKLRNRRPNRTLYTHTHTEKIKLKICKTKQN